MESGSLYLGLAPFRVYRGNSDASTDIGNAVADHSDAAVFLHASGAGKYSDLSEKASYYVREFYGYESLHSYGGGGHLFQQLASASSGSDLGKQSWRLLRRTAKCRQILFSELHVFPQATVEGHCSEFWIGTHQAIPVLALWGRLHYYEGYS